LFFYASLPQTNAHAAGQALLTHFGKAGAEMDSQLQ
jgi:hypothetical protein